jgi:hypothetical protein
MNRGGVLSASWGKELMCGVAALVALGVATLRFGIRSRLMRGLVGRRSVKASRF